ncbi:MAG: S1 RNA-binding domain-containing protein, partial [candidate division KSB1 bacterium]|nr:S1 RNA-binding domain-containing protein [candidate division KSB1 bacterium]
MVSQSENPTQPIEGEMVDQQKNNQGGDSTPTNVAQQGQSGPVAPAIVKLEELKDEKEYSNEEFDQLSKLYEETLSDYVEGEVVMGKILSVGTREVTVDIGFKSEGTIPIEEFSNPEELKVGSDIEVYIDTIEDSEGRL